MPGLNAPFAVFAAIAERNGFQPLVETQVVFRVQFADCIVKIDNGAVAILSENVVVGQIAGMRRIDAVGRKADDDAFIFRKKPG
ncbi:MAG: hypothetical protein IPL27_12445 [Lewinellaceae bacterium]|nr:hypothetical protein [Lewinellaceae bacterium]